MRIVIATLALASLAACASGPMANGDVANYDTLKTARADCAAKGGELSLINQGDPQRLSAYECKRKPAQ